MFVLTTVFAMAQRVDIDSRLLLNKWEVVKMEIQHESVLEKDYSFVPPKKMIYNFISGEWCILDVTNKKTGKKMTYKKYWEFYPDDRSIEFFDQKPVQNHASGPYKIISLSKDEFTMYACVDGKCYIYHLKPVQ